MPIFMRCSQCNTEAELKAAALPDGWLEVRDSAWNTFLRPNEGRSRAHLCSLDCLIKWARREAIKPKLPDDIDIAIG